MDILNNPVLVKLKESLKKHPLFYENFRNIYYLILKAKNSKKNNKKLSSSRVILKSIQKINNGKRCFIIGNGPSLKVEDVEKLKNEYTFASNGIINLFEKTFWRPTYYCIQDSHVINQLYKRIIDQDFKYVFMGINICLKYPSIKNCAYIKMLIENYYPNLPKFSSNLLEGEYEGFTVTYMCLQIAAYMGFNEIYLLGIDHNYSMNLKPDGTIEFNNVKDHFSADDIIENLPQLDKSTLAYQAAKKYADKHGIKIYNATRGGKLEVFERVDFDSLFPEDDKT